MCLSLSLESVKQLGSIGTCDLLGVNYSLHNGLYCTKWVHSYLLFGQLLHGLKSSIIYYVPISSHCLDWKNSCNISRLVNRKCEWTQRVTDLVQFHGFAVLRREFAGFWADLQLLSVERSRKHETGVGTVEARKWQIHHYWQHWCAGNCMKMK